MTNLKDVRISPNDQLVNFDVVSLFTQVPIDHALKVVEQRLSDDRTLIERTAIPVQQLVQLTELCLRSTNFKFQGKSYEQTDGAAMGSLLSAIIANLFMERTLQRRPSNQLRLNLPFGLAMWMTPLSSGSMVMKNWPGSNDTSISSLQASSLPWKGRRRAE